jgi:hypothetical protein
MSIPQKFIPPDIARDELTPRELELLAVLEQLTDSMQFRPMHTVLPVRATGGPIRERSVTTGSDLTSTAAILDRLVSDSAVGSISAKTADKSRNVPSASTNAGFSAPGAPYLASFTTISYVIEATESDRLCASTTSNNASYFCA